MESALRKNPNPLKAQFKNKVTEIEMTYHHKVKAKDRPQIECSNQAYQMFKQLWSPAIGLLEECHLLLLDHSCRALGHMLVSKGDFHTTLVDPKVIYSCALKARSSSIIIAHNHRT